MRYFDDENRRERLPCKLGNGGNRANKRVLISSEMIVLSQSKDGGESKNCLVKYLQKVNPYEKGEDDAVCFAPDAFVLNSESVVLQL